MTDSELIDELVAWETGRFQPNGYRGRTDAPAYELTTGRVPVLVSAPHAVTHIRDGKVKPSEDFTGAIALAVARAAECHALVATRTGEGDPNWDPIEKSEYKQALCRHVAEQGIALVLDLHGMVAASDALAAVGSADGATLMAHGATLTTGTGAPNGRIDGRIDGRIEQHIEQRLDERAFDILQRKLAPWCEKHGKPVLLNGRYGARGKDTVARTVARECRVSALQIEIATQLRVPANLHGHVPRGEKIPFSNEQLPVELVARRSADPDAVLALVEALVDIAQLT